MAELTISTLIKIILGVFVFVVVVLGVHFFTLSENFFKSI